MGPISPDVLNLNAMLQPVQAKSVVQDPNWFIWGGGGRLYAIVKDYRGLYSQQARPSSSEKESLVRFTSENGFDGRHIRLLPTSISGGPTGR